MVTAHRKFFGEHFANGAAVLSESTDAAQNRIRRLRTDACNEINRRDEDPGFCEDMGAVLRSLDDAQARLDEVHYALSRLVAAAKQVQGKGGA